MTSLINRGLNFSILPDKIDMTQVNVDLKSCKRAAIWNEFWFGRESEDLTDLIFKKEKDNLPKNYTARRPEDLFKCSYIKNPRP